jgi:predicted XRE-type DNA-binding protein
MLRRGEISISHLCELLCISSKTIARGCRELDDPEALTQTRIRLPGGGRKATLETCPELQNVFHEVLRNNTAGSPMDEQIKWTNLNRPEIAEALAIRGYPVSVTVVDQLLEENDFRQRRAARMLTAKKTKNRDKQFIKIKGLIKDFSEAGNPVISMDSKKKEYLGNLYRDGKIYTTEYIKVLDHDFPHFAEATLIPHGIYDVFANEAAIHIGTSHDTAEFACESLYLWWEKHGKKRYPEATCILVLCDSGGSNDCRSYLYKQDLLKLANRIGVPIRMAHYPPYTSKYNPIEHRVFCHVTRSWKGVIFRELETVKELTRKTKTKQGLRVFCEIIEGMFNTGRKFCKEFKENVATLVQFDADLPDWNYQVNPN